MITSGAGFRNSRDRLLVSGAVLRLLHRNLVDVRQGTGAGGAFDGLDGNVLDLLLGLVELLFQGGELRRLAGHQFLQPAVAQLGDALFGFGVLEGQNGFLLVVAGGLADGLGSRLLGFGPQPIRKPGHLLAERLQLLLLFAESGFALFPPFLERLLLVLVGALQQALVLVVLVLAFLRSSAFLYS